MAIKDKILILLFIGIAACATSNECPAEEDMPDCSCFKGNRNALIFYCHGGSMGNSIPDYRKLLQDNNLAGKRNIVLNFNLLHHKSSMSSRVFEGFDIIELKFSFSSQFTMWADEKGGPAFVGLEDTLKKITFNFAIHMSVSKGKKALMSLGHLRKLRTVEFHGNIIETFVNDWFDKGPSSLEVVKLQYSAIRSIGSEAFASLTNLKEIVIEDNSVERVSRSMFPNPANQLEEINLSNNKLTDLPDDMFTNMPSLINVDLSGNDITRLPENVWRPVWSSLTHLDLESNALNCDDHIDWVFKVRPPKNLRAKCYKPKYENLEELIKRKQQEY